MAKTPLPLAQGFYVSESLPLSAQECVNLYPSIPETRTLTEANLFMTPGLEEVEDAGSSNTNRGAHVFNGRAYFVNADTLYRLDRSVPVSGGETFSLVPLGTIPGSERVKIADNGTQMCIVVPELSVQFNAYIYEDVGETLTQVSDSDFDGPVSSVEFIDGYFVFTKKDGNKYFISALRDGLNYNALDFADAESDPDPIQAPAVYRNQLIIFGTETFESFQNVGGPDFPFIRTGVVERKGLFAPSTLIESDGFLFWIGGTSREKPQIYIYSGARPERISTRAIEFALKSYSKEEIEAAFAWEYSEDGSTFIGFTLPSETFVYDLSTQVWHQRASDDVDGNRTAYRISNIIEAYGDLYTGDIQNGNIGRISKNTLDEYGANIKRRVVLPPIDANGSRIWADQVELYTDPGTSVLGENSKVRLSWSDNGGRTFSDPRTRTIGVQGNYTNRVIWRALGSFSLSRMFALEISDKIRVAFIKLVGDLSG